MLTVWTYVRQDIGSNYPHKWNMVSSPKDSIARKSARGEYYKKERENANWSNYEGKFMLGGDVGKTCGNVSSYYRTFNLYANLLTQDRIQLNLKERQKQRARYTR